VSGLPFQLFFFASNGARLESLIFFSNAADQADLSQCFIEFHTWFYPVSGPNPNNIPTMAQNKMAF
jgi:hypothetical protein